jgi:hypothetical protein
VSKPSRLARAGTPYLQKRMLRLKKYQGALAQLTNKPAAFY